MPLLTTSAFHLGRRLEFSSMCYLHCLHTLKHMHNTGSKSNAQKTTSIGFCVCHYSPMAAMPPAGKFASDTQRPRQYADRTVSSAVRQPSAYAQPSSPTEWPTMPSGSIPSVRSTSTSATWIKHRVGQNFTNVPHVTALFDNSSPIS